MDAKGLVGMKPFIDSTCGWSLTFFCTLTFLLWPSISSARDLGFRYKNGVCVDQAGKTGLNPGFFGQCADLRGASIHGLNLDEVDFSGSDFEGLSLHRTSLKSAIFVKVNLKQVEFEGADLSNADFSYSDFSDVDFLKLNAPDADFRHSNLNKAKFHYAKLNGSNFSNAILESADLRFANLSDIKMVDTRFSKAIFNKHTLLPFSKEVAEKLEMNFRNSGQVLIVWDVQDQNFQALVAALKAADADVDLWPVIETEFRGGDLSKYTAIIHFDGRVGNCNLKDVPEEGQLALVKFVKDGGTFVQTEWSTCRYFVGKQLQNMREILLFDRVRESSGQINMKRESGSETHVLLAGIEEFSFKAHFNVGQVHSFSTNPSTLLMSGDNDNPMVATRYVGNGRVVGFGFTCNDAFTCMNDKNIQRLFINAVNEDW